MATNFTSLPVIDLEPLRATMTGEKALAADVGSIGQQLRDVFETVGFAYLVNCPLSFSHDEVFTLAREFFDLPPEEKMAMAKRSFQPQNQNTYRGYFPVQEGADNLKEGFEMGPPGSAPRTPSGAIDNIAGDGGSPSPFVLTESNVFPPATSRFGTHRRESLEKLYDELQGLSVSLLRLLTSATAPVELLDSLRLDDSVSTLRLLHYPAASREEGREGQELCCTPHTDSGLLTLLHQDATGGLEVLNATGEWIAAPYVPGSLVVNIGDLMAGMMGGRFVATRHRVRSSPAGRDRYSVPFFFEPGVDVAVGKDDAGREIRYGDFVLGKMKNWIEFQDVERDGEDSGDGGLGLGSRSEVDVGA